MSPLYKVKKVYRHSRVYMQWGKAVNIKQAAPLMLRRHTDHEVFH